MRKIFAVVIGVLVAVVWFSVPVFAEREKPCSFKMVSGSAIGAGPNFRSDKIGWHKTGEGKTNGGYRLIFGSDCSKPEGVWIQSKYYAPNREVQVVVTNWNGQVDITARMAKAEAGARQLDGDLRSRAKVVQAGPANQFVCEW